MTTLEEKKKSKRLLFYLSVLSTVSLVFLVYINWQIANNTKEGLENFTKKMEDSAKGTSKSVEELKETFEKIRQNLIGLEKPLSAASNELENIKKSLGNANLTDLKEELAKITQGIEEKITGFSEGIKNLESGLKDGLGSASNIGANLDGLKTELEELKKLGEKFVEKIGTSTLTDLFENLTKQIQEAENKFFGSFKETKKTIESFKETKKTICPNCDQPHGTSEAKLRNKKWVEKYQEAKIKVTVIINLQEWKNYKLGYKYTKRPIGGNNKMITIELNNNENNEIHKETISNLIEQQVKEVHPETKEENKKYLLASFNFTGECDKCSKKNILLDSFENNENLKGILELLKK